MWSPRRGSRPSHGRRLAMWAALAMGWVLPSTGCQVEYAGMTLPSGKYMHDDVQYFQPGPDFPWANTQAATQRARMQAMGMEVPPPGSTAPGTVTPGRGALPGVQFDQGRIDDVNPQPMNRMPGDVPAPPPPGTPAGGAVPPPAAGEATTPGGDPGTP